MDRTTIIAVILTISGLVCRAIGVSAAITLCTRHDNSDYGAGSVMLPASDAIIEKFFWNSSNECAVNIFEVYLSVAIFPPRFSSMIIRIYPESEMSKEFNFVHPIFTETVSGRNFRKIPTGNFSARGYPIYKFRARTVTLSLADGTFGFMFLLPRYSRASDGLVFWQTVASSHAISSNSSFLWGHVHHFPAQMDQKRMSFRFRSTHRRGQHEHNSPARKRPRTSDRELSTNNDSHTPQERPVLPQKENVSILDLRNRLYRQNLSTLGRSVDNKPRGFVHHWRGTTPLLQELLRKHIRRTSQSESRMVSRNHPNNVGQTMTQNRRIERPQSRDEQHQPSTKGCPEEMTAIACFQAASEPRECSPDCSANNPDSWPQPWKEQLSLWHKFLHRWRISPLEGSRSEVHFHTSDHATTERLSSSTLCASCYERSAASQCLELIERETITTPIKILLIFASDPVSSIGLQELAEARRNGWTIVLLGLPQAALLGFISRDNPRFIWERNWDETRRQLLKIDDLCDPGICKGFYRALGSVGCSPARVGERCAIICGYGYRFAGSDLHTGTIECLSSDSGFTWTNDAPCTKISCSDSFWRENHRFWTLGNRTLHSTAVFTAPDGYYFKTREDSRTSTLRAKCVLRGGSLTSAIWRGIEGPLSVTRIVCDLTLFKWPLRRRATDLGPTHGSLWNSSAATIGTNYNIFCPNYDQFADYDGYFKHVQCVSAPHLTAAWRWTPYLDGTDCKVRQCNNNDFGFNPTNSYLTTRKVNKTDFNDFATLTCMDGFAFDPKTKTPFRKIQRTCKFVSNATDSSTTSIGWSENFSECEKIECKVHGHFPDFIEVTPQFGGVSEFVSVNESLNFSCQNNLRFKISQSKTRNIQCILDDSKLRGRFDFGAEVCEAIDFCAVNRCGKMEECTADNSGFVCHCGKGRQNQNFNDAASRCISSHVERLSIQWKYEKFNPNAVEMRNFMNSMKRILSNLCPKTIYTLIDVIRGDVIPLPNHRFPPNNIILHLTAQGPNSTSPQSALQHLKNKISELQQNASESHPLNVPIQLFAGFKQRGVQTVPQKALNYLWIPIAAASIVLIIISWKIYRCFSARKLSITPVTMEYPHFSDSDAGIEVWIRRSEAERMDLKTEF